jgi:hypothetical protein
MIGQCLHVSLELQNAASSEGAEILTVCFLEAWWMLSARSRAAARQNVIVSRHRQIHRQMPSTIQDAQDTHRPVSLSHCALVRFIATIVTSLPASPHSALACKAHCTSNRKAPSAQPMSRPVH